MRSPACSAICAIGCLIPAIAPADRLTDIPTASKLPFQDFRLEYADEASSGRTQLGYFDWGVGTSLEASLQAQQLAHRALVGTADLTYNYISPLSGLSPGIAFGVKDLPNTTQDGRRFFACMTFRDDAQAIGGDFHMDVTIGAFIARKSTPFAGFSIPFSSNVRLLAEHDGIRIAAGGEYSVSQRLALRFLVRGSDVLADLAWRGRF